MKLEINRLTKKYKSGKFGLYDFSLSIESGVLGLVGPNGAGKSTLMRIISTVSKPTNGNVVWNDFNIIKFPNEIRKVLGYLPQDFGVYPNLNVVEFLTYLAAAKGLSGNIAKDRIHHLLDVVNLSNIKKQLIGSYSGGMKQRIGIAQALLNDPKILIVDEPTVGLDPEERVRFRNLMAELAEDKIVILSSHIISDIEAVTNDIAVINKGQLLKRTTPNKLISNVNGKVWEFKITSSEFDNYRNSYLISSVMRTEKVIELRVICDEKPSTDAIDVSPNLEDAYLYLLGSNNQGNIYE